MKVIAQLDGPQLVLLFESCVDRLRVDEMAIDKDLAQGIADLVLRDCVHRNEPSLDVIRRVSEEKEQSILLDDDAYDVEHEVEAIPELDGAFLGS